MAITCEAGSLGSSRPAIRPDGKLLTYQRLQRGSARQDQDDQAKQLDPRPKITHKHVSIRLGSPTSDRALYF